MTPRTWGILDFCNVKVKKGTKAFYIFVPHIKKVEDEGDEKQVLIGFGTMPVFRVEDTEGEPLEYENIDVPAFPLIDRAKSWGISVKTIPGNYQYYGYYLSGSREIAVASKEECVSSMNWHIAPMISFWVDSRAVKSDYRFHRIFCVAGCLQYLITVSHPAP